MVLLVADDESYIRQSLLEMLEKAIGDSSVMIYLAADGASALQQALLTPPDLLITDIRMPRMDGIALAEQVRKLNPVCKIVFLTNYSDKAYLRKAISLQAAAYIDKPVDRVNFIALVLDLVKQHAIFCDAQKRQQDVIRSGKEILMRLWSEMLRSRDANPSSIRIQLQKYALDSLLKASYRCLFVLCDNPGTITSQIPVPPQVRLLTCESNNTGLLTVFFYGAQSALTDDCVLRFWAQIKQNRQVYGLGVGKTVDTYRNAFDSYALARLAANRLFFSDKVQCCMLNQLPVPLSRTEITQGLQQCMDAAARLDFVQCGQLLEEQLHRLRNAPDTPVDEVQSSFCRAMDQLIQISAQRLLTLHQRYTNFELYQKVYAAGNIDMLGQLLYTVLSELEAYARSEDYTIKSITNYILEHYTDPMLDLDRLSSFSGYSKSYLCTVFKRLTGTTINSYIIQVRIDKACELLNNPAYAVSDVAAMTGFTTTQYFIRVFKSCIGQTPNRYRKQ